MKDYQVTEMQMVVFFATALVAADTTVAMIAAVLALICFVLAGVQRKRDAGKEPRCK